MRKIVLIPCKIERGGFSSERTFLVDLSDRQLAGIAHIGHLRDSSRNPLSEENEPDFDEHIDGYVECRIIRKVSNQAILVEFPNSETVIVQEEVFREFA